MPYPTKMEYSDDGTATSTTVTDLKCEAIPENTIVVVVPLMQRDTGAPKQSGCPGDVAGDSRVWGVWRRSLHDPKDGFYMGVEYGAWSGTAKEAARYSGHMNSGVADHNWNVDKLGPRHVMRPLHGLGCECWGIWVMPSNGEHPHWLSDPNLQVSKGPYITMCSLAAAMRGKTSDDFIVRHRDRKIEAAYEDCGPITDGPYEQHTGRVQRPAPDPEDGGARHCRICDGSPCDCEKPVWTYAYRHPGTKAHLNVRFIDDNGELAKEFMGFTRREAIRKMGPKGLPGYEYGPLQRITEPVHVFGGEQPTDRCDIDGCWVHVECKLPWCGRTAKPDAYCSDRCREYDEKRMAVEERLIHFSALTQEKVNKALAAKPDDAVALTSEVLWAEKMYDEELAVIERQFRSLRTEKE